MATLLNWLGSGNVNNTYGGVQAPIMNTGGLQVVRQPVQFQMLNPQAPRPAQPVQRPVQRPMQPQVRQPMQPRPQQPQLTVQTPNAMVAPQMNDTNGLVSALKNMGKYTTEDQARILMRAGRSGIIGKNVADAYIGQLLSPQQYNMPSKLAALGQALTTNPVSNLAVDTAKVVGRIPVDVSNQAYNHVVAPALHLNKQDLANGVGPNNFVKNYAAATGADGSLHQTVSDVGQGVLLAASGGLSGLAEKGITGATGFIAPKAAANAATLARFGLHQASTPLINNAIRYGTAAAVGGVLNPALSSLSAAGQNATPGQIAAAGAKAFIPGVALGVAAPAVGDLASLAGRSHASMNQHGYAKLPSGKLDPAPDLHPNQKAFINDYAEMLQGMDAGNGVSINHETGVRSTSNSPFYRQVYADSGRPPTKADWFNEARRQIESGKGMYGASDDFKTLPTLKQSPELANLLQTADSGQFGEQTSAKAMLDDTPKDPLASLKQEALKYKSADEYLNSFEKRYHQTSPEAAASIEKSGFKVDNRTSGANDILPVGVNTKAGLNDLGLGDADTHMQVHFAKDANVPKFANRDALEKYFYDHKDGGKFREAVNTSKQVDATYQKAVDDVGKQIDARYKELYDKGIKAKDDPEFQALHEKEDAILEEWSKKYNEHQQVAQAESTRIAKQEGWDGVHMDADVGSFGRTTDNTIILDSSKVKTKQQLTDLYNQAHNKTTTSDPVAQLKAEALKYKNVDEFIKSSKVKDWSNESYGAVNTLRTHVPIDQLKGLVPPYRDLKPGRDIKSPVKVKMYTDPEDIRAYGQYRLVDGNHRVAQTRLNGGDAVDAHVALDKQQLAEIYNQAHAEAKAPAVKAYQTIHQGGVIKPVQGEPVDIVKGVETYVHKDENGNWVVSEATTGRSLTNGGYPNQHHAIEAAKSNIRNVGEQQFKKMLAENKLAAPVKTTKTSGVLPASAPLRVASLPKMHMNPAETQGLSVASASNRTLKTPPLRSRSETGSPSSSSVDNTTTYNGNYQGVRPGGYEDTLLHEANVTPEEYKAGKALDMSPRAIAATKREASPSNPTITGQDRTVAGVAETSAVKVKNQRLSGTPSPEDNALLNDKLSKSPPPSVKLPKLQQVQGDLKPMAQLPTKNVLFSSKLQVLRKSGTKAGNELADRIQQTDAQSNDLRAKWMHQISTVHKLSDQDFQDAWNLQEGKKLDHQPSEVAVQGSHELKKLMPEVHQAGFNLGLLIGERKNYMPHNFDWAQLKKGGSKYDSMIQYLMDTGQIKHNEAVQLFKNMSQENARRPNHFGNFENARMTDAPGYEQTKQVLYNYIQKAAQRISEAQNLGLDNQIAGRLLTNIRQEGGDVDAAAKAVENYMRSADRGRAAVPLRTARGVFGVARLSKAAISHGGQTANTMVDTGVTRTVKAWGAFLRNNKEHKDFVDRTGVINPQALHHYEEQFTTVKGVMGKATAPGLTTMMKINRSVTALAYRGYGDFLARTGKLDELRNLGVTGDIKRSLTNQQQLQVARGGVQRTMFGGSRAMTPTYAETPLGKVIGQYRTAYAYPQTRFIYERVLQEAKNGNLKPLARYLTVSAAVGVGTVGIKNKISGRKEGIGGMALDALGALGGIPGELLVNGARYGRRDVLGTAAGDVAPLAGEAVKLGEALQHGAKSTERYALKLIPGVGGRVSNALLPPKTKQSGAVTNKTPAKTQIAKGAKQAQTGIYQVKAKDGSIKYATKQGSNYRSFSSLNDAKAAQAKNEFKYSKQTTTTINGQQYHKTATGTVIKGSPPIPKMPTTSNTSYDPNSNTWTRVTPSTGKTVRVAADGTQTVTNPGIGKISNARSDYVSNITALAKKYNVDPYAALSVAAMEGLGGGVGDGGHAFGPFQLNDAGGVITGRFSSPQEAQAWSESPAGIDYALQEISKVAGGKTGQDAINAIVNGFERPANPGNEIAGASAIYSGKSASVGSGQARTVKIAQPKTAGTTSTKTARTSSAKKITYNARSARIPSIKTPHLKSFKTTSAKKSFTIPKQSTYKVAQIKTPGLLKLLKRS